MPALPRKLRDVGAPIAAIIVLGTLVALILVLLTSVNPLGTVVGFVLTSIAMTAVVLAYLWLDRWEPEPPRLLVLAFLWGASVAVLLSVVLELVTESVVNPAAADAAGGPVASAFTVAVAAPVIEEAAKGLFLLIMMTGRRRHELNSLTDCLVYAGITAAGFGWIEDIFYIADGDSLGASLATAALRLLMAPFAHPLFTTFTGIGVYFALQQRHALAKVGCIALGYAAAVVMHGLWNGSALFGVGAYFGLYVLWMMPVFALAIVLAVQSRRREQRVVAATLPGMVTAGLISPAEAGWLGSLRARKHAIAAVTRVGGRRAGREVKTFAAQVVELAFVRDRIDRGFGDPWVHTLLYDETQRVYAARAVAAPALQHLSAHRHPG
ncbi:PrsW family intramembrane metalloprotease [Mycolicibacterium palauense]|uniref:PrsW family intramembrane metalloprotease n=1 Tax=Mycolicibacterium palauense TaxID=2034511 RepID=UPI000BFED9A1|nr:PrsW family intramembrane metalloprotease [Mycolicibacterium palauense]